jgi:serine-type D-Ala-D-Ala carboxypeptidase
VSGHSFADVCRERIFAPLGLRDTYFEVPEAEWDRVVRRPASFPGPHLNVRERITAAMPQGGLSSTAWDLAVFGQAFLNGGSYAGAQLLSTASVAQMTHNQIPGVPGSWLGERVPEGYRGLGWSVYGPRRTGRSPGQLSDRAFGHGGAGGSLLCIDPELELVVVWLSVGREEPPANQHAFIDTLVDCTADR